MFKKLKDTYIERIRSSLDKKNKDKVRIQWTLAGTVNSFYDVYDLATLYLKMRMHNYLFYFMFSVLVASSALLFIKPSDAFYEKYEKRGISKSEILETARNVNYFIIFCALIGMGGSFYLYRERAKDYEGLALVATGCGNAESYLRGLILIMKITRLTAESSKKKVSKTDVDAVQMNVIDSLRFFDINRLEVLYDSSEIIRKSLDENIKFPLEYQSENGEYIKVDLLERYRLGSALYKELESEFKEIKKMI